MKKLFKLSLAAVAAIGMLGLAVPASAVGPVSIPIVNYALTNSSAVWQTNGITATNSIAITNGYTSLSSNCTYIVQSQPFQIWRGRGFALNASFVNTNANTPVITFNFRFASVHPSPWGGSALVTNWSTDNLLPIGVTGRGLTTVFLATNIPPTAVDNYSLGQLYSIGVSTIATSTLLDPTNTFISVYP